MELKDYDGAIADFDRLLELAPDDPDGLMNRAVARLETSDYRGAVADLDRAERASSTRTRLYRVREMARRALGDAVGADRDRATFLAKEPTDPRSWCARGELKLTLSPPDAEGARKDFDAALEQDPDYLSALRDKASVLGEHLGRYAEAIDVLDRILKLTPGAIGDRAGRAVLLARSGKAQEALREVEACATLPADAVVLYQLASAALVAGDRTRGIALLRAALRKEPSLATQMPADPDLQSVWKDAVFLNLFGAAKTLSGG
jgi:tetratricopeptide (TPR) repeat protein